MSPHRCDDRRSLFGKYDVVGVSWKQDPATARRECPDKVLQGNLDPVVLYSSQAEIDAQTKKIGREGEKI